MAPPVDPFPASELHHRVNVLPNGKRRKGGDVDLKKCELVELVQYEVSVKGDRKDKNSIIQCQPFVRLFRRYVTKPVLSNTGVD